MVKFGPFQSTHFGPKNNNKESHNNNKRSETGKYVTKPVV